VTHTVEDWTECAQTHTQTDRQTDKSENSISARLGGYKNRQSTDAADDQQITTVLTKTELQATINEGIFIEIDIRVREGEIAAVVAPMRMRLDELCCRRKLGEDRVSDLTSDGQLVVSAITVDRSLASIYASNPIADVRHSRPADGRAVVYSKR